MEEAPRRIAELREQAGLSQARLAVAAGLSREQLNRIERGARTLTHTEAVDLALVLGVSLDEFSTPRQRIQFRGNTDPDAAQQTIALFRSFVQNWEMIDTLRSIDETAGQ